HHVGFWKGDHTDRLSNLMTVCTKCHTAKNHKKGGKLFGLVPKLGNMDAFLHVFLSDFVCHF
ncbi:MAG: HNH endonuclease, partial [Actinomycetaceae bacterium]|nr:HNH endonuclease [Actinomycetaceae bacterium]